MFTSLELAAQLNRAHRNVMRAIRDNLRKGGARGEVSESSYTDSRNRPQPMLYLDGVAWGHFAAKLTRGSFYTLHTSQEKLALSVIAQLLGRELIHQHRVGRYRLDGYDPVTNTAYEIDEPEHRGKTSADASRQAEIQAELGCTFVRIRV